MEGGTGGKTQLISLQSKGAHVDNILPDSSYVLKQLHQKINTLLFIWELLDTS